MAELKECDLGYLASVLAEKINGKLEEDILSKQEARELVENAMHYNDLQKAVRGEVPYNVKKDEMGIFYDHKLLMAEARRNDAIRNASILAKVPVRLAKAKVSGSVSPLEGLRAFFFGSKYGFEGAKNSVISKVETARDTATNAWWNDLGKITVGDTFKPGSAAEMMQGGKLDKRVIDTLSARTDKTVKIRSTGNPEMDTLADKNCAAFDKHQTIGDNKCDELCIPRPKLIGRSVVQKWSAERILSNPEVKAACAAQGVKLGTPGAVEVAQALFVKRMEPCLNWDRTARDLNDAGDVIFRSGDDLDKFKKDFLTSAHDAITSGVRKERAAEMLTEEEKKAANSLFGKITNDRKFHFKDTDSFLEANNMYGEFNVLEAMTYEIEGTAKYTALIKELGTQPKEMVDSVVNEAAQMARSEKMPDQVRYIQAERTAILTDIEKLLGEHSGVANPTWANIEGGLKTIFGMAHMISPIGAVSDLQNMVTACSTRGLPYMVSYANMLKNLVSTGDKRVLEHLGFHAEGLIQSAHQWRGELMDRGYWGKMQAQYYAKTLLQHWDNMIMRGALKGISRTLASYADKDWEQLLEEGSQSERTFEIHHTMSQYGIGEKEWEAIRQSVKDYGVGGKYITGDGIQKLADGTVRELLSAQGRSFTEANMARAKSELAMQVNTLFHDVSKASLPRPGLHEQSLMTGRAQAGTFEHLWKTMAWQFKGFALTHYLSNIRGGIYAKNDSIAEALMGEHRIWSHAGMFLGGATLCGYISGCARNAILGRLPDDPRQPATYVKSLLRGGGLGPMVEVMLGDFGARGKNFKDIPNLAGIPILTTGNQLLKLYGQGTGELTSAKAHFQKAQAVQTIYDNLPSYPIFKAIVQHYAVNPLEDWLEPGHTARHEKQMKEDGAPDYISSLFTPR